MANFYTKLYYTLPFHGEQASHFLELVDKHADDRFLTYLMKHNIENEGGASYCDFTPTDSAIIVTAEEQVNLGVLAAMIQLTLEAHADDRVLGFQYSMDTDRPSENCYGGGYVVVTKSRFEIKDTHTMLQEALGIAPS